METSGYVFKDGRVIHIKMQRVFSFVYCLSAFKKCIGNILHYFSVIWAEIRAKVVSKGDS